eukprot:1157232-Pelagomonas_calceolata.AAC.6
MLELPTAVPGDLVLPGKGISLLVCFLRAQCVFPILGVSLCALVVLRWKWVISLVRARQPAGCHLSAYHSCHVRSAFVGHGTEQGHSFITDRQKQMDMDTEQPQIVLEGGLQLQGSYEDNLGTLMLFEHQQPVPKKQQKLFGISKCKDSARTG